MKKISLTILLVKKGIRSPAKIFKSPDALSETAVRAGEVSIGRLFHRRSTADAPTWLDFLAPFLSGRVDELKNSSAAAALLVERRARSFVIAFGTGRHLVAPDVIEERFGLLVTLNSIAPDQIKSIDRRTFDAVATHTVTQSDKQGSAEQFGLDVLRDLVRAVTGTPRSTELGFRMAGSDALSVRVEADLAKVPTLLDKYLERFESTDYREHFAFIDHVRLVKRKDLIAKLEEDLLADLRGDSPQAYLAAPVVIEWAQVSGFKYRETESELRDDIHWVDYRADVLGSSELSVSALKHRRVFCIGRDSDEVWQSWPVYQCLNYEAAIDGNGYLLAAGKWYEVARPFVDQINAELAAIPLSSLTLGGYADADEGEFNRRVARESEGRFALMDEQNIQHGGGKSKIEFCDLYGDKILIFVKRYSGSQTMSHLFAQALVSARLFLSDDAFRLKVNEKLPEGHRLADPGAAPNPSDYELAFAIITRSAKPFPGMLPFFSKVTLTTVYRELRLFRYAVSLLKVPAPSPGGRHATGPAVGATLP